MNWDRLEGQWKQQRGKAEQRWGRIMNDELATIAGRCQELVGKLQERYGIAREDAEVQVKDLKNTIEQIKQSNGKRMKLKKVLKRTKAIKLIMNSKTLSRKNNFQIK